MGLMCVVVNLSIVYLKVLVVLEKYLAGNRLLPDL